MSVIISQTPHGAVTPEHLHKIPDRPDSINGFDLDGRCFITCDWGSALSTVAKYTGFAAVGACILLSGGICAAVTVLAIGASAAYHAHQYATGRESGWSALGNVAIDAIGGRFRALRDVAVVARGRSFYKILGAGKGLVRIRATRAIWRTQSFRSAWRSHPYRFASRLGINSFYGYRAWSG